MIVHSTNLTASEALSALLSGYVLYHPSLNGFILPLGRLESVSMTAITVFPSTAVALSLSASTPSSEFMPFHWFHSLANGRGRALPVHVIELYRDYFAVELEGSDFAAAGWPTAPTSLTTDVTEGV